MRQFRAQKLPREGRNFCDLRRIFASAKILALTREGRFSVISDLAGYGQESEPTKIRRRSHKLRPSPRRGGGNFCARNWVGFGLPRPWRDGGQIRRRPPPLAGRVAAPHGANYAAP